MLATAPLWDWDAVRPVFLSAFREPPALPTSLDALKNVYLNEDPLVTAIWACLFLMAECFVVAIITDDYSQVDRQWSIVPFVYAWHFALHANPMLLTALSELRVPPAADLTNPRVVLIAVLTTLWGLRLTFNFWRKGGYNGEEDYRWIEMKKLLPKPAFHLLNLTFIATQQHALLLAIVLPAYVCLRAGFGGWTSLDLYAAAGFLGFLLVETWADEQQWVFQNKKYAARKGEIKLAANDPDGADIARGFLTRGWFRYTRHANFWAEQSIWWAVYLFSVAAVSRGKIEWVNWSCAGAIGLTGLFQGSTWVTEWFSIRKYPDYEVYKRRVSRFLPLPPDETVPWKSGKKE
ncbi:hypothetical protein DFJ74DRAFT_660200 [Hyaloraphidium curvatum]|nr:hypothetical protein DFJ74DRAFT_660200 [Hyaloraphidium curvatum]